MKRNDLILGAAVFAASLLMLLGMKIYEMASEKVLPENTEKNVCIRVDSSVWGIWPLHENQLLEVNLDSGFNRVRVEDGEVWMEEADCPDGYCKRQGHISGKVDTIICLPHRLVVEITEEESEASGDEFDAIAK